jgi:bacterioferritin (cytochrome b1)
MPADPRMLELLSYYRDAELHGAGLLLRLMRLLDDDADAQVKLTLHVAQETQHAWLWTKRMTDMGGAPVRIAAGYQSRIGLRLRPRTLVDLLALTIVVESRSLARYREHAARPGVDDATLAVLHAITADEDWHLAWLRDKLERLTTADPAAAARAATVSERYRRVEDEVYTELVAREREVFGA